MRFREFGSQEHELRDGNLKHDLEIRFLLKAQTTCFAVPARSPKRAGRPPDDHEAEISASPIATKREACSSSLGCVSSSVGRRLRLSNLEYPRGRDSGWMRAVRKTTRYRKATANVRFCSEFGFQGQGSSLARNCPRNCVGVVVLPTPEHRH